MTDVAQQIIDRKRKYDELERDYLMLQETLAYILLEVGEPVTLLHSTVAAGLPEGTRIFIDEDPVTHDHTFGLTIPKVDNAE